MNKMIHTSCSVWTCYKRKSVVFIRFLLDLVMLLVHVVPNNVISDMYSPCSQHQNLLCCSQIMKLICLEEVKSVYVLPCLQQRS